MERVSQPLRRERVADAIDCLSQMNQLQRDMAATVRATRAMVNLSWKLLGEADDLLARGL